MIKKYLLLKDLSSLLQGDLQGDPEYQITGVAQPADAGPKDIAVLRNPAHPPSPHAGVLVVNNAGDLPEGQNAVIVQNTDYAFITVLEYFSSSEHKSPGISKDARVHETADIGGNVHVGRFVIIEENSVVGRDSSVHDRVTIGRNVKIGRACVLYPGVVIHDGTILGDQCSVKSNSVIGGKGFGYQTIDEKPVMVPQIGRVVIGSDVHIGAGVTIDRATLGETLIGDHVKIDNLVQIAHNCVIGENSMIISQCGISGSVTIGKNVILAGQVGVADHVVIGDNVVVAAKSGVSRKLESGKVYFGYPARPIMQMKRIEAVLSHLPELARRLDRLEKNSGGNHG